MSEAQNKTYTESSSTKLSDFEKQLNELEKIVAEMERGDMTLEESLAAYERGIKLTRECQSALDTAQQRITQLTEKNGTFTEEPLDLANSDNQSN